MFRNQKKLLSKDITRMKKETFVKENTFEISDRTVKNWYILISRVVEEQTSLHQLSCRGVKIQKKQ